MISPMVSALRVGPNRIAFSNPKVPPENEVSPWFDMALQTASVVAATHLSRIETMLTGPQWKLR